MPGKRLEMENGDVVDADGAGQSHTCHECDLPVGPRATVRDERLFCSDDCAADYTERRAVA